MESGYVNIMDKPKSSKELEKYLTAEHAEFAERRKDKKISVLRGLCG